MLTGCKALWCSGCVAHLYFLIFINMKNIYPHFWILLVNILFFTAGYSQINKAIQVEIKHSTIENNIYSSIVILAFDTDSKKQLIPIIRIDKVSFLSSDTSSGKFFLLKGRHSLQVGFIGYQYSNMYYFKTKPSQDYKIKIFLTPDSQVLE